MYSHPHADYNSFTATAIVRVLIFHRFSHIALRIILKLGSVKIPFVKGINENMERFKKNVDSDGAGLPNMFGSEPMPLKPRP